MLALDFVHAGSSLLSLGGDRCHRCGDESIDVKLATIFRGMNIHNYQIFWCNRSFLGCLNGFNVSPIIKWQKLWCVRRTDLSRHCWTFVKQFFVDSSSSGKNVTSAFFDLVTMSQSIPMVEKHPAKWGVPSIIDPSYSPWNHHQNPHHIQSPWNQPIKPAC